MNIVEELNGLMNATTIEEKVAAKLKLKLALGFGISGPMISTSGLLEKIGMRLVAFIQEKVDDCSLTGDFRCIHGGTEKKIGADIAKALHGLKVGREPFWMVWEHSIKHWKAYERLSDLPTVKHDTEEEAITEAKRLAVKHPGKEFHVLKSVSTSSASVSETVFHKEVPR